MSTQQEDARVTTTAQIIMAALRQLPNPPVATEALAQVLKVFFSAADFAPANATAAVGYLVFSAYDGQRASQLRRVMAMKNKKLDAAAKAAEEIVGGVTLDTAGGFKCVRPKDSEEFESTCTSMIDCDATGRCLYADVAQHAVEEPHGEVDK